MTVRTTNDTFVDLGLQASDRRAAHDHSADVCELRTANVIEVEHQPPVALGILQMKRITPGIVSAGCSSVVFPHVCQLARLAVRAGTPLFLFEKGVERLCSLPRRKETAPSVMPGAVSFDLGWLTGVEPAAFGITTQRSNQLSYSHRDQRSF